MNAPREVTISIPLVLAKTRVTAIKLAVVAYNITKERLMQDGVPCN